MSALLVGLAAAASLAPVALALWRARAPRALLLVPVALALSLTMALSLTIAAGLDAPEPIDPPSNRPLAVAGDGYVGSASCRACHPGEHASWHASFHRTMTQSVTRSTVLPQFEQLELDCFGDPVHLQWRGDTLWADLTQHRPAKHRVTRPVVQLTGSHHAQVFWYATGNGRELGIVPMVFRIEEQRWLPFPAVFLVPPEASEPPVPGTWNGNCNSCHATHSQPRLDAGRVDTHAAELGIACEACHGPGAAHAAANRDPLRRYALHLSGNADPTIIEPRRLPPARAAEVCGQCHANSIVRLQHFDSWREHGSPFRPGQVLGDSQLVVDPTTATAPELRSQLERDPHFFAGKFWPDGLSRVTGRELHGLLRSPCYGDGTGDRAMTCMSCHRLHQDRNDPRSSQAWARAQLDVGMDGNAACLQCHPQFEGRAALTAHTHHGADSPGSSCLDCHMPHTSYGLLKAVRSHVVDSPSVATELTTGRPNACNLCHLDRTLAWTDAHLHEWYGSPPTPLDDEQRTIAAGPRWLLTGDAGQRALASWAAGYAPAVRAAGTDWQTPYLAQLLSDPYIAVRIVAHRSLRAAPDVDLAGYDELATADACRQITDAVQQRWRDRPAALRAPRPELLIDGQGLQWDAFRRLLARRDDRPMFLAE